MKAELRALVEDMLGKNQSSESFSEKLKQLEEFYPPYLYKYRALNEFAIENVCNSTLWFDSPVNMNDPYDSRHTYSSGIDKPLLNTAEFKKFLLSKMSNIEDNIYLQELLTGNSSLKEIIENNFPENISIPLQKAIGMVHEKGLKLQESNFLNKIFICSLSERYDSVLMWTHYTNNHSGFCIEFELSNVDTLHHFKSFLYPVIYDENMFDLTEYLNSPNKYTEYSNLYMNLSILRKSLDWSYENEWRIVHPFGTLSGPQNLDAPRPSSILLGSNFFSSIASIKDFDSKQKKVNQASKLISFCEKQKIPISFAQHSLQKFLMERESISYDEIYKKLTEL